MYIGKERAIQFITKDVELRNKCFFSSENRNKCNKHLVLFAYKNGMANRTQNVRYYPSFQREGEGPRIRLPLLRGTVLLERGADGVVERGSDGG